MVGKKPSDTLSNKLAADVNKTYVLPTMFFFVMAEWCISLFVHLDTLAEVGEGFLGVLSLIIGPTQF
jgi:hypothetical protein